MSERPHLSIGEVLGLLQEDFPDITISKIRFLESQGLLDPERTPSGYRKFYEADISKLRWILHQQRDNFLPLKIIKDRLSRGDVDGDDDFGAIAISHGQSASDGGRVAMSPAGLLQESPAGGGRGDATESTSQGGRARPPAATTEERDGVGEGDAGEEAVSLTLDELCRATGLSARDVGELERFGMLSGRPLGTTAYYDDDAIELAHLAAAFLAHGIEARHLRMYKMAAEREVGVFEQLLLPVLKRRSVHARREASDVAAELATLGESLHEVLVRRLLDDYLNRA